MIPVPLYSRISHCVLRSAATVAVGIGSVGTVASLVAAVEQRNGAPLMAVLVLMLLVLGIARTTLRAEPVFGNCRGLWVRRNTKWRVVPWTSIDQIAAPTWSFNPVFRVYAAIV